MLARLDISWSLGSYLSDDMHVVFPLIYIRSFGSCRVRFDNSFGKSNSNVSE